MALPAGWRLLPPITPEAWAGHCLNAGFKGEGLVLAIAVAMAESSLIPNNRNVNTDSRRTTDRGILQFNSFWHSEVSDAEADDPAAAARHGYRVTNAGAKWTEWATFNQGDHRRHLPTARAAAKAVEQRGGAPSGGTTTPAEGNWWQRQVAAATGATSPVAASFSADVEPAASGPLGWVKPTTSPAEIVAHGRPLADDGILNVVVGAPRIDLGTAKVSELQFTIVDRGIIETAVNRLPMYTPVDYRDLRLSVAAHEVGSFDDVEGLTITCQSAGAVKMRRKSILDDSRTWENTSPTEVMRDVAGLAGLRFVGQGTAIRARIVRAGAEPGALSADSDEPQIESDWELGQRLAREEGVWCFEAAGTLYFAKPSWLITRMPVFTACFRAAPVGLAPVQVLAVPSLRRSVNADLVNIVSPGTVTVEVPRNVGELVRPGMAMHFAGCHGWNTVDPSNGVAWTRPFIVTAVSWSIDSSDSPVTVDAMSAIDPIATGDPLADAASGSAPSAPTGTQAGSSGGQHPQDRTRNPANPGQIPVTRNTKSALDLVGYCLNQAGKPYIFAAEAGRNDESPDAFDCSELIEWGCAMIGVTFPDGSGNQLAAVQRANTLISIDEAKRTCGAWLFRPGNPNHVALCVGDGRTTIEARGRAYGVGQFDIGTRFTKAGLIPGVDYTGARKASAA